MKKLTKKGQRVLVRSKFDGARGKTPANAIWAALGLPTSTAHGYLSGARRQPEWFLGAVAHHLGVDPASISVEVAP